MLEFHWSIVLIVVVVVHMLVYVSEAQYVEPGLCISKCLCLTDQENVLACNKIDRVHGVPTNVPVIYHRLIVTDNPFASPATLRPRNMTGLEHLRYLKVIYCHLESVEPYTFQAMKNLTYLDLSHNKLKKIESRAFHGLKLNSLHLMENPNIQITDNSFEGLQVNELNLRSNKIQSISARQFHGLKLKKLYLFNNSLHHIDMEMSLLFNRPGRLLDLTDNPLHCDCRMRWLAENLRNQQPSDIKHVNITCASPARLSRRSLVSLVRNEDLVCPQPRIDSLAIEIGAVYTQLSCSTLSHYPDTEISWSFKDNGKDREYRKIISKKQSRKNQQLSVIENSDYRFHQTSSLDHRATYSVNVSIPSNQQQNFLCSTWLPSSSSDNNILLNQHRVLVQIRTPDLSNSNYSPSSSNRNSLPSTIDKSQQYSYYLFRKQFTILEMIGAVVGTFTVTVVLLMFALHLIRHFRYRITKSISLKPYLTNNHSNSQHQTPLFYNPPQSPPIYPQLHHHNSSVIRPNLDSPNTYSHPTSLNDNPSITNIPDNNMQYPNSTLTHNNLNNNNNNFNSHNKNSNNSNSDNNNSTEYDIPRFYEPQNNFPPPLVVFDHIGFLDFKNPNKLYPLNHPS